MAGSEQIGLHGADPDLFEGAVWVLAPTAHADRISQSFDRPQGRRHESGKADEILVSSAEDHDRLVRRWSRTSPTCVAATLMNEKASAGAEQGRGAAPAPPPAASVT